MFLFFLIHRDQLIRVDLPLLHAEEERREVLHLLVAQEPDKVVLVDADLRLLQPLLPRFAPFIDGLPLLVLDPAADVRLSPCA